MIRSHARLAFAYVWIFTGGDVAVSKTTLFGIVDQNNNAHAGY